jgi:hypothetical protein
MSNYTKSTNFATKDALPSGDPLKIVKGTEIDTEFNNIATAVATKADLVSPTFTGTPLSPTASAGTNTTQIATTAYADTAIAAAKQALYPVGSIYINAGVTTNPATLLGFGTWVAFGAGRVMVGLNGADALFDALEETGGSKDATVVAHTHTGTTGIDSPNHTHNFTIGRDFGATKPGSTGIADGAFGFTNSNGYQDTLSTGGVSASHAHSFTTASSGSSGTNANLQPYITVAMWKRTA